MAIGSGLPESLVKARLYGEPKPLAKVPRLVPVEENFAIVLPLLFAT